MPDVDLVEVRIRYPLDGPAPDPCWWSAIERPDEFTHAVVSFLQSQEM